MGLAARTERLELNGALEYRRALAPVYFDHSHAINGTNVTFWTNPAFCSDSIGLMYPMSSACASGYKSALDVVQTSALASFLV